MNGSSLTVRLQALGYRLQVTALGYRLTGTNNKLPTKFWARRPPKGGEIGADVQYATARWSHVMSAVGEQRRRREANVGGGS